MHADDIPLEAIAEAAGTPTYVYSATAIRAAYRRLHDAFAPLGAHLHYAVKASPNRNLLKLLRSLGAGMDVVSGGEMERAWLAGTPMSDIVFAGVGKTDAEVRAALDGRFSPVRDDAGTVRARPIRPDRGPGRDHQRRVRERARARRRDRRRARRRGALLPARQPERRPAAPTSTRRPARRRTSSASTRSRSPRCSTAGAAARDSSSPASTSTSARRCRRSSPTSRRSR